MFWIIILRILTMINKLAISYRGENIKLAIFLSFCKHGYLAQCFLHMIQI